MSIVQNGHEVDDAYVYQNVDGTKVKRTLAAIYYGGKLVWEKIVGYIFTRDGYSLETKDKFVIKCKDQ